MRGCKLHGELVGPARLGQAPAGEADGPNDRGMAVARRHAEDRAPGLHQRLHCNEDRGGQPVRDENVVPVGRPAEVLERESPEPLAVVRGRELVVEERRICVARNERALEPGEVVEPPGPVTLLDDGSGAFELRVVVCSRPEDVAARVRQPVGERVAESIRRRSNAGRQGPHLHAASA